MNIKTSDSDDNVYTGFLEFEGEDYHFVFSGKTLGMISTSVESRNSMWKYGMKEISQGNYTWGEQPRVNQDVIIGKCNETNQRIIFLPRKGSYILHQNSVLFIDLEAYIICKYEKNTIDRIRETLIKSARAVSERFFLRQKNGKQRNTVCISCFSFCMDGEKDKLSSRRRFIQRFLKPGLSR